MKMRNISGDNRVDRRAGQLRKTRTSLLLWTTRRLRRKRRHSGRRDLRPVTVAQSLPLPWARSMSRLRYCRPTSVVAIAAVISLFGGLGVAVPQSFPTQAASGTYLPIASFGAWGPSWDFNPYSSSFPGLGDLVYLHLALQQPPSLTHYIPQLATSWEVSGRRLTVQLRGGLEWQDGKPITSTDVVDTILLDGTDGSPLWHDISNVAAPTSRSVVLTLRPGEPAELAENDLFNGITPYPASVYGQFVSPGLKADEVKYYALEARDPTSAAKSPELAAMNNAFQKLAKFKPSTLVGDGPFRLTSINTAKAELAKSPTFYDAKKIGVDGIVFYTASTNEELYPLLFSGRVALGLAYRPPAITTKWLTYSGAHVAFPLPESEFIMTFNDHKYPLNMVKVRRALAYLIQRSRMYSASYDPSQATKQPIPDGLLPKMQSLYLTKAQVSTLNPYRPNTAKAATLLRSAGFHQRGKVWRMPNGKPFTLSITVNSGTSDVVASDDVAASTLTAFGIKTAVLAVSGAEATSDYQTGSFDIGFALPNGVDPLYMYDQVLGSGSNFIQKSERGIGYGPNIRVPGLGTVNVVAALAKQAATVPPTSQQMKTLTWDWARLVNQDVPYLQYGNKLVSIAYSTSHFTWPSAHNKLWNIVAYARYGMLVVMLEDGLVHPK